MKNITIYKNGETIKIIELDSKTLQKIRNSNRHLCAYCANCDATNCPKVRDLPDDKNIKAYPFIIEGYQVIDMEGHLDTFLVLGCKNYKRALEISKYELEIIEEAARNGKYLSRKEIEQKLRTKRNALLLHLVGANSLAEARKELSAEFKNGTRIDPTMFTYYEDYYMSRKGFGNK